ncbi:MAG: GHKL domain-containing protein [Candidatus Aminicenantes bacterium]|nr:GHKL domain-containing protein [Candidatus Aminicenantes bacterium]
MGNTFFPSKKAYSSFVQACTTIKIPNSCQPRIKKETAFFAFFFVFFLLFMHVPSAAQKGSIRFHHLTIEDGLSQNSVFCILQDKKGFLWFGTQDGLNKYDGYEFTVLTHELSDPNSLSDSWITCLLEDNKGNIWVGTKQGLNVIDQKTSNITRFFHDPQNPQSLSHSYIECLAVDTKNKIWVGTQKGLNGYEPGPGTFQHFDNGSKPAKILRNGFVKSICSDRTGRIWVGVDNEGIILLDQQGIISQSFRHDPLVSQSLSNDIVNSIFEDIKGNIWVGTETGLDMFEPGSNSFIRLKEKNRALDANMSVIHADNLGRIWAGSMGNGLYIFDPEKNTILEFHQDLHSPYGLSDSSITSVYRDRTGALWVGTYGYGLNNWNPILQKFETFRHDPNNPSSLGVRSVRAIHEDRQGMLWVGGYDGLDRIDRKKGKTILRLDEPEVTDILNSSMIYAIIEDPIDPDHILWIGTEGGGLCRYNIKTNTSRKFESDPLEQHALQGGFVYALYADKNGSIWVGTEKGLNRLNNHTYEWEFFRHSPKNPQSLSHQHVTAITRDNKGNLWVGTDAGGLNLFDEKKNIFTHLKHDPSDNTSLSHNSIRCIIVTKTGRLWIGTVGGLNTFHPETLSFSYYTTAQGLPNNVIYGILEDDNGSLWMSTNKGLSQFNPAKEEFKNYDYTVGLQGNEFNRNAYYKSRQGELFFGGISGLTALFPENIKDNPHIPPVVINDFQIFNRSIPIGKNKNGRMILEKNILETKEIYLSYKDKIFSFEFTALNYVFSEKNQYAYMMEGLEKEWNYVGNRRFASYANMAPGKYVFRVKGCNNDGLWNEEGTSIKIFVSPPFWQTLWFRILVAGIVLLFAITAYRLRTKSLRERSRLLEKMVEERTAELKYTNGELKDFAHIVSHDLKAPLRGVSQLASWIAQDNADKINDKSKEHLDLLLNRVSRMDHLISGILQYSRAGRKDGEIKKVDLMQTVTEIIDDLAPPGNIKVKISGKLPVIETDQVKITQVFQNLISNAIKYIDKAEGKVDIGCTDEGKTWKFFIKDNGPGIEEPYREKIFQVFQTLQSRDKQESTGVGLSVVKKIVELYGGKIWVESKPGQESSFYFTFPKSM